MQTAPFFSSFYHICETDGENRLHMASFINKGSPQDKSRGEKKQCLINLAIHAVARRLGKITGMWRNRPSVGN
jgi:hypothetical protein